MENERKTVEVWDLPVRCFHWSLVLLIGFSWLSGEMDWMTWHMWSGYAVAAFWNFIYGPSAVIGDLKTLPSRKAAHFAGHNPVGGLSVIALILCVAVQVGTGLFSNDDILTEGPLYKHVTKEMSDWLTTIHKYNFNVLLTLIAVHVSAVLYYLFYKAENLVRPMFTGRKQLPPALADETRRTAPLALAVVILAIAAGVVYAVVKS